MGIVTLREEPISEEMIDATLADSFLQAIRHHGRLGRERHHGKDLAAGLDHVTGPLRHVYPTCPV